MLRYVDSVAIDKIVLLIVGSIDLMDYALHLQGTTSNGSLGIVSVLVGKNVLRNILEFDYQIYLQLT